MKQTIDPGLGEKYYSNTKRVINKDGTFNVTRKGTDFHPKDIYQYLVNLSWTKFFILTAFAFILFNALFGLILFFYRCRRFERDCLFNSSSKLF